MSNTGKETVMNQDIVKLSNELTYRRYLFNKEHSRGVFKELSIPDYVAMHIIAEMEKEEDIYSGKAYLQDLAEKMRLTIRQISKMVAGLRDRGLLSWAHDGDGSAGTYVMITDSGKEILANQEDNLKKFYGHVIEQFGKENLIRLLHLMRQLESVLQEEAERIREEESDNGNE